MAIEDHQETLPLALLFPALGELICLCSQIQLVERKVINYKRTCLLTDSLWGPELRRLSQSLPLSIPSFHSVGVCPRVQATHNRLEAQTKKMIDLSGERSSPEK